jgi:dTDP-glucose pyrophosphorylase
MARIDRNQCGIVLVVDDDGRLVGTLTDGDLRRAILAGALLDHSVGSVLESKTGPYARSTTAPVGTEPAELLRLMQDRTLRQLPLVDEAGRVVDLALLEDFTPSEVLPLQAVIMAGGFGTRLHPLTDSLPKVMLPVGGQPLMERTIEQLRQAGIARVNVTTHYRTDAIRSHFGDGGEFGVDIRYVDEDRPLGTAGAISLLEQGDEPLLVINGDILTRVDFRAMLDYHRQHQAELTVGVRHYEIAVPYGVVESAGSRVERIREKPVLGFFVNAGIYLLEPSVAPGIPRGERFDMTDLIERLLAEERTVVSFPITEYWLDIGQPEDYERAQRDLADGKLSS